jgi:hypothetical protein
MSKAYLLVICLLFASFSGCITDDEPETTYPVVEEDDTIEPVGQAEHNNTSSNDTYNYDNTENHYYFNNESYYFNETNYLELISAVEALTDEVEKLRMEIEEMKSSGYDPAEYSNISLKYDYDDGQWRTINFSKMGNTIHMNISFGLNLHSHGIGFYDNTGQMISYNRISSSYDQCYANGNWTTSYSECGDWQTMPDNVIHEFNLSREPSSVRFGDFYEAYWMLESFP